MNPRIPAALTGLLLIAALTACSGAPAADPTPTPDATTPAAEPPVEPVATQEPVDTEAPTCETIITAGTVDALTEIGWTPERKDFVIGDVALPDGMLCFWADYSVATDHGQLYGWAAISADEATKAQTSLLASGWIRENAPEGSYFTEDPRFSLSVDEQGYGMTYLFGDGWVKLSDTKQGLILVDWAG